MGSKKRERQKLNRLRGRPVRIVVCGYPSDTFEPVLDLLKSAVLYGDEVVLFHPLATMAAFLAGTAEAPPDELMALFVNLSPSIDPSVRPKLEAVSDQYRFGSPEQMMGMLANPRSELRRRFGSELEAGGIDLSHFDEMVASSREQLTEAQRQHSIDSGLDQLGRAFEAGLLSILPVDLDFETDGYQRQLTDILRSPGAYPVFDRELTGLVQAMVKEGIVTPGTGTVRRGAQPAMTDQLLANLPTFPRATMDEVVGIRDDLRDPLVRFRSEMIDVTAELSQLDENFDEAAVELWHHRVAPNLLEIDELTAERGLLRDYGVEIATEAAIPGAVTFAAGLQTGSWALSTIGPVAAVGVKAAKKASDVRRASKRARRENPYFFLHGVQTGLG